MSQFSCLVASDSLRPHGLQPISLLHPWDFPGKSTGVGCHGLLWAKVLNSNNSKCWWGFGATNSHTFLVGIQNCAVTSANSSAMSYKSKHTLLLSGFHSLVFTPMNRKHVHKRTCTRVFLETLFIIVKMWKQARFPLVVSWSNKLVHPDNRIFSSKKK